MTESGLRREEAAFARREKLRPSLYGTAAEPLWELTIVGKRAKERTVPVSPVAVSALDAPRDDRLEAFEEGGAAGPLLSPPIGHHAGGGCASSCREDAI